MISSAPAISKSLSPEQQEAAKLKTQSYNRWLKEQKQQINKPLDQTDFFRILSAQLANQDPLNPLEDKEFIAQMAQFSSLDQTKGMSANLAKLSELMQKSSRSANFTGAVGLLGKEATVSTKNGPISGAIQEIKGNEFPQVRIGNQFYEISDITNIE